MRPLHLSSGRAQASVVPEWLQHCINQICCCVMQVQHCLRLFCNYLSCVRRKSSTIVIADIASTSLVMVWLMYIIHVTLRENEEDAQNTPKPVRVSEFLKVGAAYHHWSLAAMWIASECHGVSPYISLVVTILMYVDTAWHSDATACCTSCEKPLQAVTIGASYQLLHALHASPDNVSKVSITYQMGVTNDNLITLQVNCQQSRSPLSVYRVLSWSYAD